MIACPALASDSGRSCPETRETRRQMLVHLIEDHRYRAADAFRAVPTIPAIKEGRTMTPTAHVPHVCADCGKTFRLLNGLTRHRRQQHGPSASKPTRRTDTCSYCRRAPGSHAPTCPRARPAVMPPIAPETQAALEEATPVAVAQALLREKIGETLEDLRAEIRALERVQERLA